MLIDIIDDHQSLCELRRDWDAVYDSDPESHFFLSWTWMSKWLGDVIQPWIVLAARPETGEMGYVAFFPLRVQTRLRKDGVLFNELQVACQATNDFTGLICRPEHDNDAIPAMARHLAAMKWAVLDLTWVRASDKRFELLLSGFVEREFKVNVPETPAGEGDTDYRVSLYVDLPTTWDAYLDEKLSAKTRQRIRNYLRKVEGGDRFRVTYPTEATIERDLDILLRFWAARWGHEVRGKLSSIQEIDRTMLRHCFDEGVLFMPVLWEGERPLGTVATLIDRRHRTILFKLFGRDETFQNPSPGVILIALAIRHAIGEGFERCDFLQGNHAYKYTFGVDEFQLKHCLVLRKSARSLTDCLDARWLVWACRAVENARQTGQIGETDKSYRQILKVDSGQAEARLALAESLARKGHHAAAERVRDALVRGGNAADPEDGHRRDARGRPRRRGR